MGVLESATTMTGYLKVCAKQHLNAKNKFAFQNSTGQNKPPQKKSHLGNIFSAGRLMYTVIISQCDMLARTVSLMP